MASAKAFLGFGIGVVVLLMLLGYAIRAYRSVKKDYVHKLARKDSKGPTLTTSAQYSESFLGTSAGMGEASIGPVYNATIEGPRLRVVEDRVNMN